MDIVKQCQNLIKGMNLPHRKIKSKEIYENYILMYLEGDIEMVYTGISKNFNSRLKQHLKTKNIFSYSILNSCNSKANSLIIESYLILYFKLFTNQRFSNKRTESNIF